MATRKTTRSTTNARRSTTQRAKSAKESVNKSLGQRFGDSSPYAKAAIATGAVTAVAAAAAGAFFFSRRDKSFGEATDELTSRVKDGLEEAKVKGNSWLKSAKEKLGYEQEAAQLDIAEEALTLKETGKKGRRPVDDTIAEQTKAGAVAY